MISQRTQSLLDRFDRHADHPLATTMKAAVLQAHTAAEAFAAKKAELATAGTMTPKGQHQALRDALVHQFGKDLARSRDPVRKAQKEITKRREALKVKGVDRTDIVGALDRKEIREHFLRLNAMERQALAITTTDARLLEALVVAPPELSGFTGDLMQVIDKVEQRYLDLTYPDEIAALSSLEAVVAEGAAGIDVAQVLMKDTSNLDDRAFDILMRPIEQKIGAPWLIKNDIGVTVCEVGADGIASYRPATEADLANGVYYESAEAFRAAQGMAA